MRVSTVGIVSLPRCILPPGVTAHVDAIRQRLTFAY